VTKGNTGSGNQVRVVSCFLSRQRFNHHTRGPRVTPYHEARKRLWQRWSLCYRL